jgi:pimeloyl-ACP methyl ester carboxylesterase
MNPPPLRLSTFGSFFVGGRLSERQGLPVSEIVFVPGAKPVRHDPNGPHAVEHLYVQHFTPQPQYGAVALHLWHGGGLTGAIYESRPDGREGWLPWFARRGWRTLVADGVERGRAGWGPDAPFAGEPVFTPVPSPYERFRLQARKPPFAPRGRGTPAYPHGRLPQGCEDALARYFVPRWTTTDSASVSAYTALIERIGPSAIIAHSQSAHFAFRVAAARPREVRAIVAIEPTVLPVEEAVAAMAEVPVLLLYGDHMEKEPRWRAVREFGQRFADRLAMAGGAVEIVDLPRRGVIGNSHLMMLEDNSDEVAELIHVWLATQDLWRPSPEA